VSILTMDHHRLKSRWMIECFAADQRTTRGKDRRTNMREWSYHRGVAVGSLDPVVVFGRDWPLEAPECSVIWSSSALLT